MRRWVLLVFVLLIVVPSVASAAEAALPLLLKEDFADGADRWQPTDPAAWRVRHTERGNAYNQFKQSKYAPPRRSPFNVSLLKDYFVGDFVLTVRVQSTHKTTSAHRDMCVFFGYQDNAHFYYAHLGKVPDPNSSQIMIVDDAPRRMITENKPPGIPWDDGWHTVKVVRRVDDGLIEIYFDDVDKPNMVAHDKTFAWGRIGLGSFDDHGNWDELELRGVKVERPEKTKEK
ncbi:MAG: hypothetical protein JW809_01395 [Pirellulales bacterium]|nr:hypothetical protein [Pirellulales bacterium]